MLKVTERLKELVSLNTGWDGYNAVPVSTENAVFALKFIRDICSDEIPFPQIVPGTKGDLQLEWHFRINKIEVHIYKPDDIMFILDDPIAHGQIDNGEIPTLKEVILKLMKENS
jgi:hypothetical protein